MSFKNLFFKPRKLTLFIIIIFILISFYGYQSIRPDKTSYLTIKDDIMIASIEKPSVIVDRTPKPLKLKPEQKITKTTEIKLTPKPEVTTKPKSNIIFFEDFKKYEDGDIVSSWGKNFFVSDEGIKFLDSKLGDFRAGRFVDFPKDFSFEVRIVNRLEKLAKHEKINMPIRLTDSQGLYFNVEIYLSFLSDDYVNWQIALPGTFSKVYQFGKKKYYDFKLTYKDREAKVYMDGELIIFRKIYEYSNFVKMEVSVFHGCIGYTNFVIRDISGSVIEKPEEILAEAEISPHPTVTSDSPVKTKEQQFFEKGETKSDFNSRADALTKKLIEPFIPKRELSYSKRSGEVVFKENFSSYSLGDPLLDWGYGVVVLRANDGRKCMSSQSKSLHTVSHEVLFPEDFSFEMEFVGKNTLGYNPKHGTHPVFIDTEGREFKIRLWGNAPSIELPGTNYVNANPWNTSGVFKLTKKGSTFKVYWRGQFIMSGYFPQYSRFIRFSFVVHANDHLTNIIIKGL